MNTLTTSNPHVDEVAPIRVGEVQVRGAGALGGGINAASWQLVLDLAEHGHVVFAHGSDEDSGDVLGVLIRTCGNPMDPRLARISFLQTSSSSDVTRRVESVEEHLGRKVNVVVQRAEELDHHKGDVLAAHQSVTSALSVLAAEGRAVVAYSRANRRSDLDILASVTSPGALGNQNLVAAAGTVLTMTREQPVNNPANQPTSVKGRFTLENPRASWHVFKVGGAPLQRLVTVPMRFDVDHSGLRACWHNG